MGRHRKRNRLGEDPENPLNSIVTSTRSSIAKVTMDTLSHNFSQVLVAIQKNGKKLDMVNDKLTARDVRVSKLDVSQLKQCSKVTSLDTKTTFLTNENTSLKSQIPVLVDEAKTLSQAIFDLSDRASKLEIGHRGKNIIVWNAACETVHYLKLCSVKNMSKF
ncbi:hypothetical protein QYM36_012588 [Artemia franciscana]|uniref:Uncharacterized protein n=1 Tax=Artemia franciscana TaxID=6661 RepID=A0AA88HJH3_ARTSF|nr:hypothetical protein QYM36_012588 [Artemia franciscana]